MSNEGLVTAKGDARLFFQILGSGAKTVLVPNGICLLNDLAALADEFTLILYDPRNRGRSDSSPGDIVTDIDDLDTIRRHFDLNRLSLIGHSYMGLMVALYAMRYPAHVDRTIQIGPMEPVAGKQYPAHLTANDGVMADVFGKLGKMQRERDPAEDPIALCRRVWSVLNVVYVANAADAGRIQWGRCELANELNFMSYWMGSLLPSIQRLTFPPEEVAKATAPILTIHGTKDRNAPYGGGRDWAAMLPNARLVTIEGGAHAPWIEAPAEVFGAIRTFLRGEWPRNAEKVLTAPAA